MRHFIFLMASRKFPYPEEGRGAAASKDGFFMQPIVNFSHALSAE